MAQLTYKFDTPKGAAGGIVDLAPYAIDTFLNEENDGVLEFGIGVVSGTKPGKTIKIGSGVFEGIVTNNRTTMRDITGSVVIRKGASVGVMRYGRIYGRLDADADVSYGDAVYMTGDGYFTEDDGDGDNMAIAGVFRDIIDADNGVAEIELFNSAQPVPVEDTVA